MTSDPAPDRPAAAQTPGPDGLDPAGVAPRSAAPELAQPSGSAPASPAAERRAPATSFPVGSQVGLSAAPRYLRSADPMPMLRPPDLIDADESGLVVELRPRDQRAVRFRRGTFLLDVGQLRAVP